DVFRPVTVNSRSLPPKASRFACANLSQESETMCRTIERNSCELRIRHHLEGRMIDLNSLWTAHCEGREHAALVDRLETQRRRRRRKRPLRVACDRACE